MLANDILGITQDNGSFVNRYDSTMLTKGGCRRWPVRRSLRNRKVMLCMANDVSHAGLVSKIGSKMELGTGTTTDAGVVRIDAEARVRQPTGTGIYIEDDDGPRRQTTAFVQEPSF